MSTIALSSSRQIAIRSSNVVARSFSSTCEPAERLKCVFEEYRQKNYSRETPKRFKKELIKACTKTSTMPSTVAIESLNQILVNIGRPDQRLSEEDMNLLLGEMGYAQQDGSDHKISVDNMMKLI